MIVVPAAHFGVKSCRLAGHAVLAVVCEARRRVWCRFAKVALQRLMEVVQKGDEMYHGVVLDILKAIFEVKFPADD